MTLAQTLSLLCPPPWALLTLTQMPDNRWKACVSDWRTRRLATAFSPDPAGAISAALALAEAQPPRPDPKPGQASLEALGLLESITL